VVVVDVGAVAGSLFVVDIIVVGAAVLKNFSTPSLLTKPNRGNWLFFAAGFDFFVNLRLIDAQLINN
jgi:hypothetical protein